MTALPAEQPSSEIDLIFVWIGDTRVSVGIVGEGGQIGDDLFVAECV